MGKQANRKRRNRPNTVVSSENAPVILQRIRHANASIRQAALCGALHAHLLHRKDSGKLLLAVREQYMGQDSHCAEAAAACLIDYLEVAENVDGPLTAGWAALAVDRLLKRENVSPQLIVDSLHMLALLIEENPLVMDRLMSNTELRENCIQCILSWIETSSEPEKSGDVPSGEQTELVLSIRTLSARCLDSLFQDNANLFETLLASNTFEMPSIFRVVVPFLLSSEVSTSQLHFAGAWLSAWTSCKSIGGVDDERLRSILSILDDQLDSCASILSRTFQQALRVESISTVHHQLEQAYREWQAEVADQELDQEIIRQVNARKESARQIVRRLALKKQQRELADHGADTDAGDGEQDNESRALDFRNKEEIWFGLYNDYLSMFITPVSLALEVMANLLLPLEEDGDAVMHEASVMHPALKAVFEKHCLVKLVHGLMHRLCRVLVEQRGPDGEPQPVPSPIRDSLCTMGSKLGTCLTHALQHLPDYQGTLSLWRDLSNCLLVCPVSGISHAMAVCLRQASSDEEANDVAAKTVMDWLEANTGIDPETNTLPSEVESVTRDMICMLGSLCTNDELLSSVVTTLINTSRPDDSLLVRAERLNVLIDAFADDCRHTVFEEMKLLEFFKNELPLLQRKIALYHGDDAEFVQETAMNAGRFIQYKKGYL